MRTFEQVVPASGIVNMWMSGRYFRLLDVSSGSVTVEFWRGGVPFAQAQSVSLGVYAKFNEGFDGVSLTGTVGATVKWAVSDGEIGTDSIVGTVSLSDRSGALANTAKTVTTTSAELVAANTARRYLAVQNKDAAGSIWIRHGATAATTSTGYKLGPGESVAYDGSYIPTGAVQAIGDAASNANIVVVEG